MKNKNNYFNSDYLLKIRCQCVFSDLLAKELNLTTDMSVFFSENKETGIPYFFIVPQYSTIKGYQIQCRKGNEKQYFWSACSDETKREMSGTYKVIFPPEFKNGIDYFHLKKINEVDDIYDEAKSKYGITLKKLADGI